MGYRMQVILSLVVEVNFFRPSLLCRNIFHIPCGLFLKIFIINIQRKINKTKLISKIKKSFFLVFSLFHCQKELKCRL